MIGEDCVVHDLVQQPDVSLYFFSCVYKLAACGYFGRFKIHVAVFRFHP
jgi:hypothetical protein